MKNEVNEKTDLISKKYVMEKEYNFLLEKLVAIKRQSEIISERLLTLAKDLSFCDEQIYKIGKSKYGTGTLKEEIFIARFIDRKTYSEIARTCNCSMDYAKHVISDAKKELRKINIE